MTDETKTPKLIPATIKAITHNGDNTYRVLVDILLVGSETPTPFEFDTSAETAAKMDIGQEIYIPRPEHTPCEQLDKIDRIIEEGEKGQSPPMRRYTYDSDNEKIDITRHDGS